MNENYKLLVVDDELIVRESLLHWFEEENYQVDTADSAEEALKKLQAGKYDVYLLDMKMPGMSGIELLEKIKEVDQEAIVILITAYASVQTAIKALKEGAYDYLTKPVDPDELNHILENALKQKSLTRENIQLKENIDEIIKPDNLIGESEEIKKIYSLINTVAPTDTTVMIRGESGTGKELVAKAIHINSRRRYFPIVTVNCGALAESILESELFGHEKGAFTSAIKQRKGCFEQAEGGTLFLDEIGDMSLSAQAKVLRALQENRIMRVGGEKDISVNVRVVAATNKNVQQMIKDGSFREDLFHRLSVITLHVPSLNDRREDVPLLVNHFNQLICAEYAIPQKEFSNDALKELQQINWTGNIRELRNVVERLIILSDKKITGKEVKLFANK